MRSTVRINHRIRVPEVRCIGPDGEQIGIVPIVKARQLAEKEGLDLVEVAPTAKPPVCRIMDFGKFRYDENRKEKLAKKHQSATVLKEIKFHANVEEHDYQTKLNHIMKFLERGHRVKTSLFFRGRENEHRDLGIALFDRIIKDVSEQGIPEHKPKLFGNNLVMMLIPNKH